MTVLMLIKLVFSDVASSIVVSCTEYKVAVVVSVITLLLPFLPHPTSPHL